MEQQTIEKLRKSNLATYRNFFARYETISSVNYSISWTPSGFSKAAECLRTRVKTPFECVVGLRPSKNGKTSFSPALSFETNGSAFVETPFSKITDQEAPILELIADFLKENRLANVEIGILSEISRGHGFGFSGTMATALTATLFVYAKKCRKEDFESDRFEETAIFSEIFSFASKMARKLRYDSTLGSNISAGLTRGNLFLAQPAIRGGDPETASAFSTIRSYGDKFGLSGNRSIPMDYGVLFSGLPTDTKSVEAYKTADETYLDKFAEFLNAEIAPDPQENGILERLSKEGGFHRTFSDAISALSVETAYFLKKMLEKGYEESLAERLVDVANQLRNSLATIIRPERFPEKFRTEFLNRSGRSNADIGLFPIYGGKMGGGYLFVTKPHVGREAIDGAIDAIRSLYPNANVEYANYSHGESFDRVRLRQNFRDGFVADELRNGGGFLYQDNAGGFRVAGMGEILAENKNDLLFNEATGEIYVRGEIANSKQFKSQNATIELFLTLLEKGKVSSLELPSSSYSKNRSEMQSKILGPVLKISEETF